MKIDLYTKSILTVIAISLIIIASKNTIPHANAEEDNIQKVSIVHVSSDTQNIGVRDEEVLNQLKKIVKSTDRTCKDLGFKFCSF